MGIVSGAGVGSEPSAGVGEDESAAVALATAIVAQCRRIILLIIFAEIYSRWPGGAI
jgi:hypothetical protein